MRRKSKWEGSSNQVLAVCTSYINLLLVLFCSKEHKQCSWDAASLIEAMALGSCFNSVIQGEGARGRSAFFQAAVNRVCKCLFKMLPEQSDLIN